MGVSGSKHCRENRQNPDFLSVITLTDSLVQRLPLAPENNNPLEREAREQSVDDFWKDRMECMENAFMESLGLSEAAFTRKEKRILSMSPPLYKPKCPMLVNDLTQCMSVFAAEDPLKCNYLVRNFCVCIDTVMQDEARRSLLKAERAKRKQCAPK